MLLLAMALLGAPAASPRRVSMWYAPGAYGGTDINASLDLLAAHPGVVGSLLLYCGHEVTAAPGVSGCCTTRLQNWQRLTRLAPTSNGSTWDARFHDSTGTGMAGWISRSPTLATGPR